MKDLHALAVAPILVCLFSFDAAAFMKCKTADGKLIVTDTPPPGCIIEGELKNDESSASSAQAVPSAESAAHQTSTDSGDAQSIAARRRIERELSDAADELAKIRQELANAPRALPGIYVDLKDGSTKVHEQTRVQPKAAAEIGERERQALDRIQKLKEEFANLTHQVEKRHGGRAPSWWAPVRCDRCP